MHLKPKLPVSKLTKFMRKEWDNEKLVRPGNRGGKNTFDWDDVKKMKYWDRECYLG